MVRTRMYQSGALVRENFPVTEVAELLADKAALVWVDFDSPSVDELRVLEEELGLHPLAVEDAMHPAQRAKLDRYSSHLFLATYTVTLDETSGRMTSSQVSAFITPQALVTIHSEHFDTDALVERWDSAADLAGHGIGFLVWGLLDMIVDGHFDAVEQLDDAIDSLEDLLFDERPRTAEVQRRSFELRKSLLTLRRVVVPMREVLNTLLRRDLGVVANGMEPYLQDVYDHVVRATETTESLRELVATILETNLSLQGNRMNLIMKKVTSWAAIIAVPTAITGFYGQNLPYPGFNTEWGFLVSTGLIVLLGLGLYVAFRKRDWL
ncbi:magnesium transporter CorA family protein [Cryobacterium tepidiphilum]|uniref:Magnesium transporter n=1 Tax=Cryobacterium tepidiphilum TaxID=2486026 RepID=A0A3M8LAF2_9MICO|nr:magnesium transporter CorA family protein [Cryobacterium tepidiphilum]RNE62285.1 magnesium transporter [Cryobacterium tepidiphilum]